METILAKRTKQIQASYNHLVQLEDIYCKLGYDYGLISDELIDSLRINQSKKKKIKENTEIKSMAEFTREYELSAEYLILKSCKYQLKAIERLMSGLKVRIESLRNESRGLN
jgi:hypothetical protein